MSFECRIYASISCLSIVSGIALSPIWRQAAITWIKAGLLQLGPLGTKFSEIQIIYYKIFIHENAFRDVVCYMTAVLSRGDELIHWDRMTHICVGKLINIGSNIGLSPETRQISIWTNAWILLIGPSGTNFSDILIEIHTFSFKKLYFKMSFVTWRPFCPGGNELKHAIYIMCNISIIPIVLFSVLMAFPCNDVSESVINLQRCSRIF